MADTQGEAVLNAVREAVPRLRANGLESEDRRWITDENIALLEKAEVFRAGVPRRFGGLDLGIADHIRILLEISRGCGSTGWVCQAWITGAWIIRRFPEKARHEVYAGGSVKVSGGFTPSGTLTPVDGGYLLNGSWRFNTGCRDADWNLAATKAERADGTVEPVMAVVPMGEFTVADDWRAMAAAGTGSSTSTAKDVFVPAHRVTGMIDAIAGTTPSGEPGRDYRLVSVVMIDSAAVLVGMAKGVYEMFRERVPGRPISYTGWRDQAQHPLTHIQLAEVANRIAAAEALLRGMHELVQTRADAGQPLSLEEQATVRGQCGYTVQLAKQATEIAYGASGASAIMLSTPIQRFYRDVQGISMHAMMSPAANLELQGRVLLGLEPNTVFL